MPTPASIIGNSAALALALEHVSLLAPINRPVLVLGERGTGKELIAQRLHFLSPRWDQALIKVNCAAMAETLLESELFGHEPGAFTGATRVQKGRFERADGGSLFLDELGSMSLRLQEKLLRLVEYGEFERLGGQETLRVDVRVIAATNADLPNLAQEGKFRADLLDRLSFDVVHLPSLQQRPEDIPQLAEHFAMQMCSELGWQWFPGFSREAMQALQSYSWPGNIRELKNAVERSLHRWGDPESELAEVVIDPFVSPYSKTVKKPESTEQAALEDSSEPTMDFASKIATIEKQLLQQALNEHGHNQRQTAEALGLSYDQLRGLVRKYQLGGSRRKP
ncbi:phage shock protein operon transcriptional activator [Parahaliea sp. F7430]|uniref:Phage shock protein operon transcriptional activator n=1 Tax=Sediminihaliea albiluteola TaxID=2758564 RepID=A0A7W2TV30_9GAMM|nr:phage shock protein operon transcriptional activator [Sediminihaliea albiluteola]MBA6412500.1 phage shock protein operon transcriptional activator [Sediminihaliea albiluteola]